MKIILVFMMCVPAMALADSAMPIPAPDPVALEVMSSAANQNASAGYNAATDYSNARAYQAAAQTAQDIANQDAAQSSFGYSDWQLAASEAQGVANDQTTQSLKQTLIEQQNQVDENTAYLAELNAVAGVQQANDRAVQLVVKSGSVSSFGNITSATGVQQGQLSQINDTSYVSAGATTQALMNGLSTDGYEANIQAIQDEQNAQSCGNPYCAAAWMAANAVEQGIADADYNANVAAAPVLGTALNSAALTTSLSNASQQLMQIQSFTGVTQGQATGTTSTTQALQQIAAQTGVNQGQASHMVDINTAPYVNASDNQQSALNSASQQNENDAWTAAQAWQAGLNAQHAISAATTIENYDSSMAGNSGSIFGTLVWQQAAAIAQTEIDQLSGIYDTQQAIQNAATSDENNTYNTANSIAPTISDSLNTAASSIANSHAQNTLQQISAATGVAQ